MENHILIDNLAKNDAELLMKQLYCDFYHVKLVYTIDRQATKVLSWCWHGLPHSVYGCVLEITSQPASQRTRVWESGTRWEGGTLSSILKSQ